METQRLQKSCLRQREARSLLQTYKRKPVSFVHGEGVYLFDDEGKRYLDFGSGIAVNALGHGHPAIIEAIHQQSQQLIHCSNLYHSGPMVDLAEDLIARSFASKVFFCNSGTEANEAALKFARRFARRKSSDGKKHKFVAFKHGFHGRTFGSLSVTAKANIQDPFRPLLDGVIFADFNDTTVLKTIITPDVAGVIVEPVQGEGGVHIATFEFMNALRHACDLVGAALIFDEVQCGMGRTGDLWAHESYGVVPDIMTLAKPLGGGLPLGAVLLNDATADAIAYGDHGSTFGGNLVATSVGRAVLATVSHSAFLQHVAKQGSTLGQILQQIKLDHPEKIKAVRGRGLIWGVDTEENADLIVERGLREGLILLTAGEKTLRLLPPLVINDEDLAQFAKVFAGLLT